MQDLFYFSRNKVDLESIRELAIARNLECIDCRYGLKIMVDGTFDSVGGEDGVDTITTHQEYWDWETISLINGVDLSLSPESERFVAEYNPASALMVTFHWETVVQVREFLFDLLNKYGGWVGLDDEWVDKKGRPINILTPKNVLKYGNKE